jgi:hypothetical protein
MARARIEKATKLFIYMQRLCLTHTPFSQLLHTAFPITSYSVSDCFIQRFCIYCYIQLMPRLPSEVYFKAVTITYFFSFVDFVRSVPSASTLFICGVEILVSNENLLWDNTNRLDRNLHGRHVC